MPRVYLSYDPRHAREIAALVPRPAAVFKAFPVVVADLDGPALAALRAHPGVFVHESEFSAYLAILESLEATAARQLPLANISLSPGPAPFDPREPVTLASSMLARRGQVLVFAAGNDGPAIGTLSPWCQAPWVIGVGAATDSGEALLELSSAGDPANVTGGPTVVAPGRTIVPLQNTGSMAHGTMVNLVLMGKDVPSAGRRPGLRDIEFTGTSVATPRVTRLCSCLLGLLQVIEALALLLQREGGNPLTTAGILRAAQSVADRDRFAADGLEILDPLAPATLRPLTAFFAQLALRGLPPVVPHEDSEGAPYPTGLLKRILAAMARPMPGYGAHQVGAGFVSEEVAREFLLRLSPLDLLKLLFPARASSLAAGWPDADAPLVPAELHAFLLNYRDGKGTQMQFKVV